MGYTSRNVYEFIADNNNDPIREWKICLVSGQEFPIFQSDLDFYNKVSPTFSGKKIQIPSPTLCPEERQRRRLSFRNERKLYRRKCAGTQKDIISLYSPDKELIVYDQVLRWSDVRDQHLSACDFVQGERFASQMKALFQNTPQDALTKEFITSYNSDYTNSAGPAKNCYMVFELAFCEDVLFSEHIFHSKSCIDCTHVSHDEQCYECLDSYQCQSCVYCLQSTSCAFSRFLYNCTNCSYCFMSSNLVNKQYCILNKQYNSKQEYLQKLDQLKDVGFELLRHQFFDLIADLACIRLALQGTQNENVFGTNTTMSKNSSFVVDCNNIKDCKYSSMIHDAEDCYDFDSWGENASLCYEVQESGRNISNCLFCRLIYDNCKYLYYCVYCISCSDCFACVGLRNKQYCIFNKQYPNKEEYEKKVVEIITQMQASGERGEFFHPSVSPFGYNETIANEYFPLDQDDLVQNFSKFSYRRSTYSSDPVVPDNVSTISGDSIPDISLVSDDICKQICICEVSGRPYRITIQELIFHRKYAIPLPRKHPDIRYEQRRLLRPGRQLFLRTCDKTGQKLVSSYPQDVSFSVYGLDAYNNEVYG